MTDNKKRADELKVCLLFLFILRILFALRDKILLIIKTLAGNVFVENQEAQQVRNRHQAVHGVGQIPNTVERLRRADKSYATE